ncbi:MAG: hypothetical protein K2Y18_02635 [Alphaproteobacteria bacterium]|jgi:hypothetical protein|nr:hypothetical protein [Alphaproteobacteria bacterium]
MFKFKLHYAIPVLLTLLVGADCTKAMEHDGQRPISDRYTPQTFPSNVKEVIAFTVKTVLDENNARFKNLPYAEIFQKTGLVKMDLPQTGKEDITPSDLTYNTMFGAACRLHEATTKQELTGVDMLKVAEAASLLLSPEIFDPSYSLPKNTTNDGIYNEVTNHKLFYAKKGTHHIDKGLDAPFEERTSFGYELTCEHFMPVILTGENAIYTEEDYLYATWQKKALYGLNKDFAKAHGYLFDLPILLFIHDQAHMNDQLMPNTEGGSPQNYMKIANIIADIAGRLLAVVNSGVVPAESRPLAIAAGFRLLHENHIYQITPLLAESFNPANSFHILMERWKHSLTTGLFVVGSQMPISTMTKTQLFFKKIEEKSDPKQSDPFCYTERFHSDEAISIADIYADKRVCDIYKDVKFSDFIGYNSDAQLLELVGSIKAEQLLQTTYLRDSYRELTFDDLLQNMEFVECVGDNFEKVTLAEIFKQETLSDIMGGDIQSFIFGTETDTDHTRVYHGRRALTLNLHLYNWFEKIMKPLIK